MQKYSVLMSLYWKEKPEYLRQAIDSMLNQTVKPDEIVIVKDGPLTQELEDVLNEYCQKYDPLFHIVTSEKNLGLGLALNLGIQHCGNELIARMDTDDISKPERCEKQLREFENHPDLAIVGSHIDEFCDTPEHIVSVRKVPTTQEEIYQFAKRRNAFNHPSVMYRKGKILEAGGYNDQRRGQDLDLFGRMLFSGCLAKNIDESLLYFRFDKCSAERRGNWESTKNYIDTIRRFWKMGYANFFDYYLVLIAKMSLSMCPIQLQNLAYRNLLRS